MPLQTSSKASSPELLHWSTGAHGSTDLVASGAWTVAQAAALAPRIEAVAAAIGSGPRRIDLGALSAIDTFGATLLDELVRRAKADGAALALVGLAPQHRGLVEAVMRVPAHEPPVRRRRGALAGIEAVGRVVAEAGRDFLVFLAMLGAVSGALGRVVLRPRSLRLTSVVHHLDRVGLQAIPIIVLITLLVGAIVAQQGIFHFRRFGADSYVVDLLGFLVLRELGVLLVAIMVAGRSGSSYTAELGAMRMREEIDALRTMGLDPVEILILPRLLALVCALPMLAFVGAMSALAGGGLVSWIYGGMSPAIYLARLRDAVSVQAFEVGMVKAPFMALVIGVVACAEGFRVQGSTESLGLRTTASVVESIFLMIVLDGLFALFFAGIGM